MSKNDGLKWMVRIKPLSSSGFVLADKIAKRDHTQIHRAGNNFLRRDIFKDTTGR